MVHPSWILDSIKAARLLPVNEYLLYQGRKASQKVLNFTSKLSSTCTTSKPSPGGVLPVSTSTLQTPNGGPEENMSSTSIPSPMGEPSVSALLTTRGQEQFDDVDDTRTTMNITENDSVSTEEEILTENPTTVNESSNEQDRKLHDKDGQDRCNSSLQATSTLEVTTSTKGADDTLFKRPSTSTLPRAGDANFVSEFYNNSRLHYLSTWGAEFKKYTSDVIKSCAGWKGRGTGQVGPHGRVIMHIDMDSFFVSVTLRDQPHLRGKPIAVCHAGKGNSSAEQGEMNEGGLNRPGYANPPSGSMLVCGQICKII